jgi:NAD-dependent deacetylase
MKTTSHGLPSIPRELITALQNAKRVTVLTGAGVSAESGIPTFREALTGLWANYNPEELASPLGFQKNPGKVWDWYAYRRERIIQVEPNPGHYALAAMEKHFQHFSLITQNIDGLHQKAGSQNVIELHGNIRRIRCSKENKIVERWEKSISSPPCCPDCGHYLRPDVVWFGEVLPDQALNAAWKAAENCDIFFSIGTSALVNPAAMLSYFAIEYGAILAEVNVEETPLTPDVTFFLQGASGKVLPAMIKAAWNDTITLPSFP